MNGKSQFLGSSTQKLSFSSSACRVKNEIDKLYNLKKILCFCVFPVFQKRGSFVEVSSSVYVRHHVQLSDCILELL